MDIPHNRELFENVIKAAFAESLDENGEAINEENLTD